MKQLLYILTFVLLGLTATAQDSAPRAAAKQSAESTSAPQVSLPKPAAKPTPAPAPAADTINHLARSADQELAKTTAELNKLREQIGAEKLPLAQELTGSEEKVTQLRRDYDKETRLVDSGNLEIITIKAEMKARQDELAYIGNLLDEYARTFESKVNVSELQYVGEAITAAKQATENDTLSAPAKFKMQTDFTTVTMKRLFDSIGGMRFHGVAVDSQGTVVNGQFALIGPVALFSGDSGSAGLVIPQNGSTKPLIRALEGPMQAGLTALVQTGEGLLPLDPSRGGALQALVQKTDIVHIFKKGGPIMYPLLFAACLAILTVLERLLFLFLERLKRSPRALESFLKAVADGEIEKAIAISKKTRFYVVRALGYALGHREQSLPNALLYAQAQELKRFGRGIPVLDTVITLAPLLGLLGTVTGMMGSFSLLGGELGAPGAITGGIAEALIATAFGLGIAITSLIPFNFLNARSEEARHEMESASTQLELLVDRLGSVAEADEDEPNASSNSSAETDASPTSGISSDPRRARLELRRRRDALQREMDKIQDELEDRELELQGMAEVDRGTLE